jgi:hypothetical protein
MEASGQDPKTEALRAERTLNPHPEAVVDETFLSSGFMDARDLVQVKYEMVRRVRVDGETVSGTAAAFGFEVVPRAVDVVRWVVVPRLMPAVW